jgi:quercetin dioxygenase-like cupin family protein
MSMKALRMAVVLLVALVGHTLAADAQDRAASHAHGAEVLNIKAADIKWERIFPELGERSSEISILHVDPKTQATHLMIRVPADFHVPKHWHTANETHTVISGTFIMECEGKREVLTSGSFNYMPSKMAHEAWTSTKEGAVLLITVDAAWDINWVNGPPKPADVLGGLPR